MKTYTNTNCLQPILDNPQYALEIEAALEREDYPGLPYDLENAIAEILVNDGIMPAYEFDDGSHGNWIAYRLDKLFRNI
jgi:hypothetical protein